MLIELSLASALVATTQEQPSSWPGCDAGLVVLGVAQDGGIPQMGRHDDPAWLDPSQRKLGTSLGLIDFRSGDRFLFEATPDMRQQVQDLTQIAGPSDDRVLDGVFLTHAHIGHYTGLMFLGHESLGAQGVPVHAMPRMAEYLETNGPWSQLVRYENISLNVMTANEPVELGEGLSVTPLLVPHRQEFSEVVGYRIEGDNASALFIPDIDSWEEWDETGIAIEDEIAKVGIAYLDATFFANGEIPGRDMSGFPHPMIRHSMDRFQELPDEERDKVNFIHFNHTNPVRNPQSDEAREVEERGYHLAARGQAVCLIRSVDEMENQ